MRNLIKMMILLVVAFCSLEVASGKINDLVTQVKAREETITDAIIKQQVEETFKEVEKQIEEVVKQENIEIKTEKVEMKPPVIKEEEPTPAEIEVAVDLEPIIDEEEVLTENINEEDIIILGKYLVENYFLDGYQYYQAEEDPMRYERKKLTHEMEAYVIESLGSVFEMIIDMKAINEETIESILVDAMILSESFSKQFKDVSNQGEEFGEIYEEVKVYFNQ